MGCLQPVSLLRTYPKPEPESTHRAYKIAPEIAPQALSLDRMLHVSTVAHYFNYHDLDTWALDIIATYFDHLSTDIPKFISLSPALVDRALKRAKLMKHDTLHFAIANRWRDALHQELVTPANVIATAERSEMPLLRAETYYYVLLKGPTFWNHYDTFPRYYREVLLSGRRHIQRFWADTKQHLISLDSHKPHLCSPPSDSTHKSKIRPLWAGLLEQVETTVTDAPDKLQPLRDLLGRLKESEEVPRGCRRKCIVHAQFVVDGYINELRDRLVEFF